jgi:hypothetical protein
MDKEIYAGNMLSSYLDKYKVKEAPKEKRNERQIYLMDFIQILEKEYKAFKGNKYNRKAFEKMIALKLGHVKTEDLYPFYEKCRKANHFGKCFWGSLKVQK